MHISHSTGRKGRVRAAFVAAALVGTSIGSLVLAGPASAAPTVTVTPDDNLSDGQTVSVEASDLPDGQLALTQCGNADTDGTPLPGSEPDSADCNGAGQLASGGVKLVTGPSFTEDYDVMDNGIGDNGATCISVEEANFPCTIVVGTLAGEVLASAPIYFGEPAPGEDPLDEVPPAPDTAVFCENAEDANYSDVNSNQDVISCLAASAITQGYADGTFRPGLPVRRDQMASFLVRLGDLANSLETDGTDLQDVPPYSGVNRFTDVDADNVHVEAINRLADMGVTTGSTPVTFDPSAPVTRGQMTTFLNRMHEFLTGEAFDAAGADYFGDDDGTTHEANINAVASTGIAQGSGPAQFSPGNDVTRSQMASFLVRHLAVAEAAGLITPLGAG